MVGSVGCGGPPKISQPVTRAASGGSSPGTATTVARRVPAANRDCGGGGPPLRRRGSGTTRRGEGNGRRALRVRRTALMVPRPRRQRRRRRPGAGPRTGPGSRHRPPGARGGRRPARPAPRRRHPHWRRLIRPAQLGHQVLDGEGRAVEQLGGHRGRHGDLVPAVGGADLLGGLAGGCAEYGRIEAGGIVVGLEGLRRLAGGHVQARAQFGQEQRGHPCLPDIGPRADHGNHAAGAHGGQRAAGGGSGRERAARNSRLTSSSLCAADSVTRRRLVPTGTVGGRMAGTHNPLATVRPTR